MCCNIHFTTTHTPPEHPPPSPHSLEVFCRRRLYYPMRPLHTDRAEPSTKTSRTASRPQ